jgi:hypothetical protein
MAGESRRERIMVEIERRMKTMQQGQPTSDPYRTTFEVITRGSPLEGLHKTVKIGLAILDTTEFKSPSINCMSVNLRVVMEFFVWVDTNEQPSSVGNRVMADIQRRMREDFNLTEPEDGRPLLERKIAEHVEEVGNDMFIDGVQDTQITGAVTWNIRYKHGINDPRELVSSLA